MIDERTTDKVIMLSDRDGTPVCLSQKFIIAAFRHTKPGDGTQPYTDIEYDAQTKVVTYQVQEELNDIQGPFARVSNLLVNPAYFSAIVKNTGSEAAKWPLTILLRGPAERSYRTANDVEMWVNEINRAKKLAP